MHSPPATTKHENSTLDTKAACSFPSHWYNAGTSACFLGLLLKNDFFNDDES